MLANGLLRNGEVRRDLADRKLVASDEFQHVTPMGVGESAKNRIRGSARPITGLGRLRNAHIVRVHFRRGLTQPGDGPIVRGASWSRRLNRPGPRQRSRPSSGGKIPNLSGTYRSTRVGRGRRDGSQSAIRRSASG